MPAWEPVPAPPRSIIPFFPFLLAQCFFLPRFQFRCTPGLAQHPAGFAPHSLRVSLLSWLHACHNPEVHFEVQREQLNDWRKRLKFNCLESHFSMKDTWPNTNLSNLPLIFTSSCQKIRTEWLPGRRTIWKSDFLEAGQSVDNGLRDCSQNLAFDCCRLQPPEASFLRNASSCYSTCFWGQVIFQPLCMIQVK